MCGVAWWGSTSWWGTPRGGVHGAEWYIAWWITLLGRVHRTVEYNAWWSTQQCGVVKYELTGFTGDSQVRSVQSNLQPAELFHICGQLI